MDFKATEGPNPNIQDELKSQPAILLFSSFTVDAAEQENGPGALYVTPLG